MRFPSELYIVRHHTAHSLHLLGRKVIYAENCFSVIRLLKQYWYSVAFSWRHYWLCHPKYSRFSEKYYMYHQIELCSWIIFGIIFTLQNKFILCIFHYSCCVQYLQHLICYYIQSIHNTSKSWKTSEHIAPWLHNCLFSLHFSQPFKACTVNIPITCCN